MFPCIDSRSITSTILREIKTVKSKPNLWVEKCVEISNNWKDHFNTSKTSRHLYIRSSHDYYVFNQAKKTLKMIYKSWAIFFMIENMRIASKVFIREKSENLSAQKKNRSKVASWDESNRSNIVRTLLAKNGFNWVFSFPLALAHWRQLGFVFCPYFTLNRKFASCMTVRSEVKHTKWRTHFTLTICVIEVKILLLMIEKKMVYEITVWETTNLSELHSHWKWWYKRCKS